MRSLYYELFLQNCPNLNMTTSMGSIMMNWSCEFIKQAKKKNRKKMKLKEQEENENKRHVDVQGKWNFRNYIFYNLNSCYLHTC